MKKDYETGNYNEINPVDKKILNFKDAANYLSVKESWLRSAVFKNEIKRIKLKRLIKFRRSDLDELLEAGTIEAQN